jgi:hypothetical protein
MISFVPFCSQINVLTLGCVQFLFFFWIDTCFPWIPIMYNLIQFFPVKIQTRILFICYFIHIFFFFRISLL